MKIVNVADLKNPETGLTYRQENAALRHAIPIGALVEINCGNSEVDGLRLFVVHHGRDCDQTPLYYLSLETPSKYLEVRKEAAAQGNAMFLFDKGYEAGCRTGGYSEQSLTVVRWPAGTPGLTYRIGLFAQSPPYEHVDWLFTGAEFGSNEIFEVDDREVAEKKRAAMQEEFTCVNYRVVVFKDDQQVHSL